MINIGTYNTLNILRETSVGLFLGDEDGEDVLLPNKYVPKDFKIGESMRVFVYLDFEERKVAVTIEPKIKLGEFAFLKVMDVSEVGAFLDWGMEKELMVPFKEQIQKMEEGSSYVVCMNIDEQTDRLYASSKLDKYLKVVKPEVKIGEEVDLLVYHKSEMGYAVIVNQKYKGLIFANEVFQDIGIGDSLKGFVKKIRTDQKLDISLQAIGYTKYNDPNTEKLFRALHKNEGFLALNDKSSPEDIYKRLGMSKKAFKKSLGALYKRRKIKIEKSGIRLIKG